MSLDSPIISLRSASFGYAGRAVISDVTFDIRPGEVVGILGPNGSGKSTLMKGILGLNDHVHGEVELFGVPEHRFKQRTLIGYVPQRHTLSGSVRATVQEIVEVGRLPLRPWYKPANRHDQQMVVDALREVGMEQWLKHDVAALSGGQHRRVLIARALSAEPQILVMDEPTAGVDTASQKVLAEVLEQLAKKDVTMMIVTHEVEALRNLLTRIIEVDHGEVVFDGTPEAYAARFAHVMGATHELHVEGAHDAHHEQELYDPTRIAHGPLDRADLRKDEHHG